MSNKKFLFDEFDVMNDAGRNLGREAKAFFTEIITRYRADGYNPSDILNVIQQELFFVDAEIRLREQSKRNRESQEKTKLRLRRLEK